MTNYFLETKRLYLRKMTFNDFDDIAEMLQDKRVMYAWEYNFSNEDVNEWISKNIERYEKYNMGYFLAINKSNNDIVGQLAIIPDKINGIEHIEIGYILKHKYWKQGFAFEGAKKLSEYAFKQLKVNHVIFEIRPMNTNSIKVAEKLGAKIEGSFIKNVRNKQMEHLIYYLSA